MKLIAESLQAFLNEAAYDSDMFTEFGYFNQYLIKPLNKNEFKKLVENSKTQKIEYNVFPNIMMRYDKDFKKLLQMKNKPEKELVDWWKPHYFKMKKFEPERQNDEYYYKLVKAIKNNKVDTPIIVLSVNDDKGKNYKFICGGRNRIILSYILKTSVDAIIINLPTQKKENIQKIIDNRNG